MAKHPWEAVAGTFGEVSAFWMAKGVSKSISRAVRPVKIKFKLKFGNVEEVNIPFGRYTLRDFEFFKFPKVVKAEDVYFFGRAKGLPVEWGKYAKSGYAILKPSRRIGMTTTEMIKKMSAPQKEILGGGWAKATEFELPETIKSGWGVMTTKGFESTGVKGFIFRRATIRRGLIAGAFEFEKPPLGGVSRFSPLKLVPENVARETFETLARRVAFPIRTPPISAISLGGFSVASMERLTRIKPASYKVKPISFTMPKFKVEYKKKLNDVLSQLGMSVAFNPVQADFSRINPDIRLYISKVMHKTFIDVSEEGTEAAAVTSVEICFTSTGGGGESIPTMRVDHPFIFAIHEIDTGAILFLGKISKPEYPE